jgi:dolichol-phosphate mannosyltransferase
LNDSAKLLIVIATYNEIDNLPSLVAQLESLLPTSQILVIDDASPDGTGKWCDDAQRKHPQLSVLHRESKLGLGSATLLGFQQAIDENYPLVATMDADFSHDPRQLVDLLKRIEQRAESDPAEPSEHRDHPDEIGVVIGSRYVDGGGIEGWPLFRRVVSRCVNRYARLMLRLRTQDNSGAFRVYRTSDLKKMNLASIRSSGYGYLEEILWRLRAAGVEMAEVPIVFRDREHGKSKTSLSGGINVFWQITKMGLGRWK